MPITEQDFPDLIRLLSQEDRLEEVRRLILGERAVTARLDRIEEAQRRTAEELAGLAAQVRALAEAQRRTEERLDALAEAQRRTEERLDALAEAQKRTEERLDALAEAQRRTEEQVRALAEAERRTADRVGRMLGTFLEIKYERRAAAYFGTILKRAHVLEPREVEEQLEIHLSPPDVREALFVDLLVKGEPRKGPAKREIVLAVEVSSVVDRSDVARAARRAALLRRAGVPAVPAAAGEAVTADAEEEAAAAKVAIFRDGAPLFLDEALAVLSA